MLLIAKYSLKGRAQAALVLTVFTALAWVFPFVACFSTGILLLIALQQRVNEVLVVVGISGVAVSSLVGFSLGKPVEAMYVLLALWGTALMSAVALKRTSSLSLAMALPAVFGSVVVLAVFVIFSDPTDFWVQKLKPLFEQSALQTKLGLSDEDAQTALQNMARMMTGAIGAGITLNGVLGLLLGFWWHNQLVSMGSFQAVFHQLRLGKIIALLAVLLYVAALLSNWDWLASIAMVWMAIFVFQGLAVVHGLVLKRQWHIAWLVVLYATMFILPLMAVYLLMILVIIGVSDNWVDYRKRL